MEINNLITIVTEKISSLPTKNKDAKIRLIEEIIKYSNYWQKYAEEEFREEKAEVRTALINLYKQSDMKDLIKMDEIISHLLLNQCCLFLSKIDFIGTISSGDTPLSKSQMGIFYFVKTGDIGKLILTYVIDKNGKTELKSLEALKKWEKEIDVNNNLTHALAINEDLSITFLGQFDKLFEDGISSYNESFIMAENRGMHPYTKIKANLDIGESIPKNMSLLKRYLTPNQHLEFITKASSNEIIFFLTNVAVIDDWSSFRVKHIKLPNQIKFSNPIVMEDNNLSAIFEYSKNINNPYRSLVNLCVYLKGKGVVFIGEKDKIANFEYVQILNLVMESINTLDCFSSKFLTKENLIKHYKHPEKLYYSKIKEYESLISGNDNNMLNISNETSETTEKMQKIIFEIIVKTIHDCFENQKLNYKEQLNINLRNLSSIDLKS